MNTVEKRSRDRGDKGSKRELVPSAAINGRIVGTKNGKIYNDLPLPLPVALIPSYFRKRWGEEGGYGGYIFYFSPRKSRDSRAFAIRRREGGREEEGGRRER